MKIAFDAKRAYENNTGLGHYSRTLISSLATYFPQHHYFLCAPKITERYNTTAFQNISNITPKRWYEKMLRSAWRSKWVTKDLGNNDIDLYHGLSHEIPIGIEKTRIKTVVTIHDLIFERYPEQYNPIDVRIYRKKFTHACNVADVVIAISQQTKDDLINYYKVPAEKITICYQSCNPAFAEVVSEEEKQRIKQFYKLPDNFFLYVGSIIERKNLLNICKALKKMNGKAAIPLVVIGDGGTYKQAVHEFVTENGLEQQVIFLSEQPEARQSSFQTANDFPAIYQLASCMIYPSVFEGFGIPVLEALWSRTPVITSNLSCLPETGGDAALYVDPYSVDDIATAMQKVVDDQTLVEEMKQKGWAHAQNFTPRKCASNVMDVYLRLYERF